MALRYEGFSSAEEFIPKSPSAVSSSPTSNPATPTEIPSQTPLPTQPQPTLIASTSENNAYGGIFFSARLGGYNHVFMKVPGKADTVQITFGEWDDRSPAVSPDRKYLAFSSRKGGNWEIYLLNLENGAVRPLTDTLGFEGNPTWSPDSKWIACEAYYDGNFDIWILPVDGNEDPIRLTSHEGADLSPDWSPRGREIVFASNRNGYFDLFLADLDSGEQAFENITNTANIHETDPDYAPDGSKLAFLAQEDGGSWIKLISMDETGDRPQEVGQGSAMAWYPEGNALALVQARPFRDYLTSLVIEGAGVPLLGLSMRNSAGQLDWIMENGILGKLPLRDGNTNPPDLYTAALSESDPSAGRLSLVDLDGVSAPHPKLSDAADEAFHALRARVISEAGWDFLSNLDNAFVGLDDPMPPGFAYNDWLYTGRAFAISEVLVRAGWVEVQREDINGETYWRIFLRTRFQDGSQGEPLRKNPWDFSARFDQDAQGYDQGGAYEETIPGGYYIDFTTLAADYGFMRQSALPNWRSYYAGTRYKEFALTGGMTWMEAMLEIYPTQAVITPTPYQTPTMTPTVTPTPTPTPWWARWRTATPVPTLTPSASPTQVP
jgi:TolB protein